MSHTIKPVTMTKDDLERIVAHPEEASPDQLLGAYAILTTQSNRANARLKGVAKALQGIPFANLSASIGGADEVVVNNHITVLARETSVTNLLYDQKAMNQPVNKTASAPYRETRDVLVPKLIEGAIKDGTFPAQFHGSIETSTKVSILVAEVKDNA